MAFEEARFSFPGSTRKNTLGILLKTPQLLSPHEVDRRNEILKTLTDYDAAMGRTKLSGDQHKFATKYFLAIRRMNMPSRHFPVVEDQSAEGWQLMKVSPHIVQRFAFRVKPI